MLRTGWGIERNQYTLNQCEILTKIGVLCLVLAAICLETLRPTKLVKLVSKMSQWRMSLDVLTTSNQVRWRAFASSSSISTNTHRFKPENQNR